MGTGGAKTPPILYSYNVRYCPAQLVSVGHQVIKADDVIREHTGLRIIRTEALP